MTFKNTKGCVEKETHKNIQKKSKKSVNPMREEISSEKIKGG